jgi:hypothetical protein
MPTTKRANTTSSFLFLKPYFFFPFFKTFYIRYNFHSVLDAGCVVATNISFLIVYPITTPATTNIAANNNDWLCILEVPMLWDISSDGDGDTDEPLAGDGDVPLSPLDDGDGDTDEPLAGDGDGDVVGLLEGDGDVFVPFVNDFCCLFTVPPLPDAVNTDIVIELTDEISDGTVNVSV